MRQMSLEKMRATSSVAWFKLAEVITRGEKERALSIYRLLMHSVQNDAIKVQLEGDILLMFNDASAHHVYAKAALLHQKNNDSFEAYSLYEQIIHVLIAREQVTQAYDCIGTSRLSRLHQAKLYEKLVSHLAYEAQSVHDALLKQSITQVIAVYTDEESPLLTRFLTKLASLNTALHTYACNCISAG